MNRNSDGTATRVDMIDTALTAEFGEQYTGMNPRMRSDLIVDVNAILKEDMDAFDPTQVVPLKELVPQAVHLLYSRIGGAANLLSYACSMSPSPRQARKGFRGRQE